MRIDLNSASLPELDRSTNAASTSTAASKVPPNAVAIFSGRKHKLPDGRIVGYRMVRGGAAFRWPLLEQVDYLSLRALP